MDSLKRGISGESSAVFEIPATWLANRTILLLLVVEACRSLDAQLTTELAEICLLTVSMSTEKSDDSRTWGLSGVSFLALNLLAGLLNVSKSLRYEAGALASAFMKLAINHQELISRLLRVISWPPFTFCSI